MRCKTVVVQLVVTVHLTSGVSSVYNSRLAWTGEEFNRQRTCITWPGPVEIQKCQIQATKTACSGENTDPHSNSYVSTKRWCQISSSSGSQLHWESSSRWMWPSSPVPSCWERRVVCVSSCMDCGWPLKCFVLIAICRSRHLCSTCSLPSGLPRKLMIVPVSCCKDNSHITPGSCPRLQTFAVQWWLQKCVWLCDSNGYGRVWLWDSIPYRLMSDYETPVNAGLRMSKTSVNTDLFWSARHQ